MKTFLISQDLWEMVQEGIVKEDGEKGKEKVETSEEKKEKKRLIQQSISYKIFLRIIRTNSVKEA
jgi:hypothetical protein